VVPVWSDDGLRQILDAVRFARADEGRREALPHRWAVTSDSVAARTAEFTGASRLILLKSMTIPEGTPWSEAAAAGWVDANFPHVVARAALSVQSVNLATRAP
jgi:phage I-like protein